MSSSHHFATFVPDDSEFLDADLRLSGHLSDADFDFVLEDGEPVDERMFASSRGSIDERMFADSRGSSDLDVLLACGLNSSKGSMNMDFQFDTLDNSLHDMRFGIVEEDGAGEENVQTQEQQLRPTRRRSRIAKPFGRSLNAVNFDPAPGQQQPPQFSSHRKSSSHGDLSMCSYTTAASSVAQSINRRASVLTEGQQLVDPSTTEPTQYTKALQRLAESMKRTEESRSQVMMQRQLLLTPEQEAALSSAKEQLQKRNSLVQQQHEQQEQQQEQVNTVPQDQEGVSSEKSSIVAAFFSGSRGTLTNGLEQSRKQLSTYMNQVNNMSQLTVE